MISLFYNEIIKIIYKKRTYIGFSLIIIIIPFIIWAIHNGGNSLEQKIYGQLQDSFIFIGSLINGYFASYIIIAVLISHMPFLSTIVASEIVSGEYSKGTFRIYLTRTASRSQILFSKLIIVYIYTTSIMLFFYLYTLLLSLLVLGKGDLAVFHMGLLFLDESDILWRFFVAFFISNIIMITVSSLCFLFSTVSKNSVTPIISTISIVFIGTAISFIPIDLFEQINPFLFTGYMDLFLTAFHDPVPTKKILNCFLINIGWSLLFVTLSFYLFNKKDILD
tara:strand:- start:3205 stop:4041 length:837 start_codon:yes stop_codon:yes gene_type:complete